ncbi:MAG: hypothetical protein II972_03035 [Elusimicrobiaceae bacterium]|nr:hypothetical protein [Elusimicrobiaceae bacterium]
MQTEKLAKQNFLNILQKSLTLTQALEESTLDQGDLCRFLIEDKTFQKNFDKIINLKLELALLESALKSKAAGILSFSLINRLPKKYNKTKKEEKLSSQTPAPTKIIYFEEDSFTEDKNA